MTQDLIDTCRKALWGEQSYFDIVTRTIFSEQQMKELGLDASKMITLPHYSMAFVRKVFVESKKDATNQTKSVYAQYHLDDPSFVFPLSEADSEFEEEYTDKAHCFCEDCQMETEFWEFFDSYTEPMIESWGSLWFEAMVKKTFDQQELVGRCRCMFWGMQRYLDVIHHTVFSDPQIQILGLDTTQMITLPNYSMAFIRKEFVESKKDVTDQTKSVYAQYHLDDPCFVFSLSKSGSEFEEEYTGKAHWFCEDCQLEEEFWDFFDSYTEPIVVSWLKNNPWFEESFRQSDDH